VVVVLAMVIVIFDTPSFASVERFIPLDPAASISRGP
jgi:hypothetical protein